MREGEEKGKEIGIAIGRKEGEKIGRIQEKLKIAKTMIETFYPNKDIKWLQECSSEQLDKVFTLIGKQFTYEELKRKILEGID